MPVMTKSPKGDDIVILSRKEYDRLLAAANEDVTDAAVAKKAIFFPKSKAASRQEMSRSFSGLRSLLKFRFSNWCRIFLQASANQALSSTSSSAGNE